MKPIHILICMSAVLIQNTYSFPTHWEFGTSVRKPHVDYISPHDIENHYEVTENIHESSNVEEDYHDYDSHPEIIRKNIHPHSYSHNPYSNFFSVTAKVIKDLKVKLAALLLTAYNYKRGSTVYVPTSDPHHFYTNHETYGSPYISGDNPEETYAHYAPEFGYSTEQTNEQTTKQITTETSTPKTNDQTTKQITTETSTLKTNDQITEQYKLTNEDIRKIQPKHDSTTAKPITVDIKLEEQNLEEKIEDNISTSIGGNFNLNLDSKGDVSSQVTEEKKLDKLDSEDNVKLDISVNTGLGNTKAEENIENNIDSLVSAINNYRPEENEENIAKLDISVNKESESSSSEENTKTNNFESNISVENKISDSVENTKLDVSINTGLENTNQEEKKEEHLKFEDNIEDSAESEESDEDTSDEIKHLKKEDISLLDKDHTDFKTFETTDQSSNSKENDNEDKSSEEIDSSSGFDQLITKLNTDTEASNQNSFSEDDTNSEEINIDFLPQLAVPEEQLSNHFLTTLPRFVPDEPFVNSNSNEDKNKDNSVQLNSRINLDEEQDVNRSSKSEEEIHRSTEFSTIVGSSFEVDKEANQSSENIVKEFELVYHFPLPLVESNINFQSESSHIFENFETSTFSSFRTDSFGEEELPEIAKRLKLRIEQGRTNIIQAQDTLDASFLPKSRTLDNFKVPEDMLPNFQNDGHYEEKTVKKEFSSLSEIPLEESPVFDLGLRNLTDSFGEHIGTNFEDDDKPLEFSSLSEIPLEESPVFDLGKENLTDSFGEQIGTNFEDEDKSSEYSSLSEIPLEESPVFDLKKTNLKDSFGNIVEKFKRQSN